MTEFIPELRLKLYHATYSKKNFETLEKLKRGIDSGLSGDIGQKKGFFVWTKRELAENHINFQKERHLDYEGYPIMLILREELNNKEWDLDYEVNASLIVEFLRARWNLFKQIPDNVLRIPSGPFTGKFLLPSKSEKNFISWPSFKLRTITFALSNNATMSISPNSEYSIPEGALLGEIFDYMQEHFPKAEHFEEAVFKRASRRGLALKYIGKRKLDFTFEMFVNGKWIDEREANEFIKNHRT